MALENLKSILNSPPFLRNIIRISSLHINEGERSDDMGTFLNILREWVLFISFDVQGYMRSFIDPTQLK